MKPGSLVRVVDWAQTVELAILVSYHITEPPWAGVPNSWLVQWPNGKRERVSETRIEVVCQ